jgi:hypothetical protein
VIAIVLVPAVAVLVIGFLFSRPADPPRRITSGIARIPPSAQPGHVLYSSDADPASSGIHTLDLSTGEVQAAQPVPNVVDLVRIDDDLSSIGITRVAEDGSLLAFITGLSPTARAFPVIGGDIITWGAEGLSVVGVWTGPDVRCRNDVRAEVVQLASSPRRSVVYRNDRLCGDVLAAGHDGDRAYLAIARGEVVRTSWTSPAGVLHRAVPNRTFSSISPIGDMIVTPVRFISSGLVPGRNRDPGPIPQLAGPSELAWAGRGGPAPIVDEEHRPLQVQRTLAWAPDGSAALVVGGPLDGGASIYELPASVAEGDRVAREVWPVEGPIGGATAVDDGSWFLVMDRQLIRVTDGMLDRVALPPGAPEPTGAVLWLPTLP